MSTEVKRTLKSIRENIDYCSFQTSLWKLIEDQVKRSQIRQSLIARYFSKQSEELNRLSCKLIAQLGGDSIGESQPLVNEIESNQYRDRAFRNVVNRLYDFRCSACGIRVKLENILLVGDMSESCG